MKRREFIAAGAGAAAVAMTAGMVAGCSTTGAAGECRKGCAKVNNKDFYVGGSFDANGISSGKFDVAKGKQAYFDLMRKFGYPVFRSFTDEAFMLRETKQTDKTQYLGFWATDFAKGDFAKFGMGGVIWVDEIKEEYFGHDIFLLPLQSIAEHSHVPGKPVAANVSQDRWTGEVFKKDIPAKMESWLVRHGWVYAFSALRPQGRQADAPQVAPRREVGGGRHRAQAPEDGQLALHDGRHRGRDRLGVRELPRQRLQPLHGPERRFLMNDPKGDLK